MFNKKLKNSINDLEYSIETLLQDCYEMSTKIEEQVNKQIENDKKSKYLYDKISELEWNVENPNGLVVNDGNGKYYYLYSKYKNILIPTNVKDTIKENIVTEISVLKDNKLMICFYYKNCCNINKYFIVDRTNIKNISIVEVDENNKIII